MPPTQIRRLSVVAAGLGSAGVATGGLPLGRVAGGSRGAGRRRAEALVVMVVVEPGG